LQERGSLTPWVTPEALATWHAPPAGKRGRARRYSDLAIETGQMLRLAFHRPWRQTEGLLRSIASRLGVSLEVPDHTTFSRRSIGLPLATAPPSTAGPVGVVIDSTGLKIYGAGEWQREKHGQRGRRTWRKLHWAIHPDNGEILASELTTNEPGDRSMVGPLLDQIPGSPTLLKGTGGCPFCSAETQNGTAATRKFVETAYPELSRQIWEAKSAQEGWNPAESSWSNRKSELPVRNGSHCQLIFECYLAEILPFATLRPITDHRTLGSTPGLRPRQTQNSPCIRLPRTHGANAVFLPSTNRIG
jgi:hypothetical protein